ncbi:Uncharacterized protein, possibly involved in aromatic compounds catabolism [Brevundimonas diminuta]|uniref:Uncharacterized protein, possibly involved in aromatic compounds catabolism n=1 Tax=Brevundimonas diminuta TaxID=293 RepID=A0A2X1BX53_BREDI|nr:Uncharacterized protein, possibly involved in aromatic compounds catabolism [Brevundimonas diminuta]
MTASLLDSLPYARFLGLQTQMNGDEITVVMPFADKLIGNPMLPTLHGGSTAALLEITAMAQVSLTYPRLRLPRPINVTVAYLRSGSPDRRLRTRQNQQGRTPRRPCGRRSVAGRPARPDSLSYRPFPAGPRK